MLEIQKLISHVIQVVYAESMFANYFYLDQIKSKQVAAAITHNLAYRLFSPFFVFSPNLITIFSMGIA